MPEAFIEKWQPVEDENNVTKNRLLVTACKDLGLNMVASQPLAQGMAANVPLSRIAVPEVYSIPARHLQLIRSLPSQALVGTIVGMKQ